MAHQCTDAHHLKMAAPLFTPTPRINEAVKHINNLEPAKFPLLLSRILQKLHTADERAFSKDEETKLQTSLSLNEDELELVLETITLILKQAAYHITKPSNLKQQLTQLGLDDLKSESVAQAWNNEAKDVNDKLKLTSIAPVQLDSVHWKLNLILGQKNKSKLKQPIVQFDLGIENKPDHSVDHAHIEFDHENLYQFYNQLEQIQSQLDSLR